MSLSAKNPKNLNKKNRLSGDNSQEDFSNELDHDFPQDNQQFASTSNDQSGNDYEDYFDQNDDQDQRVDFESSSEKSSSGDYSDVSQELDSCKTKVVELEAALEVKHKEIEDWKDKAYRFSADLQNLSKQNELDLQQASKRGKKNVVMLLLPFVNTMNLSFSYIPESDDDSLAQFVDALKSSFEKLISDFAAAGIEFLVPQIGDSVNLEFMSVLNATGDEEDNIKVDKVVGVGVRIDGQLVQEATVMI